MTGLAGMALPLDERSRPRNNENYDPEAVLGCDAADKQAAEAGMVESRQGFDLWRSVHGVV